jgi:hypothetical protein
MLTWLRGKKTYIVAAAMIVAAGLRHQQYINDDTFAILEGLLAGGGLATLRAGVSKAEK